MAPSSSGGTTVGESLNILEQFDLGAMPREDALHHYLEATALAFADRGRTSATRRTSTYPPKRCSTTRSPPTGPACIDPDQAATKPVPPGDASPPYDGVCDASDSAAIEPDTEGISTTHLTAADRWGNVVAYTLTIEQTGGSGIVVPDRGFLLNNELTDFSAIH